MDALNIAEGSVVAELGAASGWFTIRLARRVRPNGKVYAEDIQPQMIEVIRRRVPRENLDDKLVDTKLGTAADPKLPVGELDAVVIVDAYHEMEQPVALLRNAARALKKNGRLGIVEFTMAGGGPGPPMGERVDPERVIREAREAGLHLIARPNMLRYQYMLVFSKTDPTATRGRESRKK
jgi:ubiquinone/menaquinone biosynthesis C-methylase UbiE